MSASTLSRLPRRWLARSLERLAALVPAAAAGAAVWSLSRHAAPPDAEAAYLALPILGVLGLAGLVAPRRSAMVPAGAVLVVLAVWVLPAGPVRGATVSALLAAVVLAACAGGCRRHAARWHRPLALTLMLAVLLLPVLLAAAYPWRAERPFTAAARGVRLALDPPPLATAPATPVSLVPEQPAWTLELAGEPVASVVLDTHLAFAVDLPAGTPVATVWLDTLEGRRIGWPLEAGNHTSEWAAGRPDVAAALANPPPAPWLSWVPPGGGFLAHSYRSVHRLASPLAGRRLTVERRSDLPADVVVVLFRAELRR